MESISAIILAAGEGKRMKSKHSKVMHSICGKPMIHHVVEAVKASGINDITVVVGHCSEEIKDYLNEKVEFAYQEQQLGTGHAVMCAQNVFKNKSGQVIILTGDTPMISEHTIKELLLYHKRNNYGVTILSAEFEDPTGYGRIVRENTQNGLGDVLKIVEHKDCSEEELDIKEVNSGIYCFNIFDLNYALSKITNDNAQKEYYLTDAIEIIRDNGKAIGGYILEQNIEVMGINNRLQLSQAEEIMRSKICKEYMLSGVTIINPSNTYIQKGAKIGTDTIIYPGCSIDSDTVIGNECIIGPNTTIKKSVIDDFVTIKSSEVLESKIGENTTVGPYAYIRPNCKIGKKVRIGDFVEIKNSTIGNKTKVSHLTYIGDADVGSGINFGCGTVVVNYDGKEKHRTVIEDDAFIGCNTNLVSPVIVRKGAYTAAGSTITKEVPSGSLAIARSKQVNKEGWVENKNKKGDK